MQVASEEPQQTKLTSLSALHTAKAAVIVLLRSLLRMVGVTWVRCSSVMLGCRITRKLLALRSPRMSSKANSTLQAKVAAWHIADIDKTIDGLGINTDGYDRDGLRAVAHLGGKGGMKKFVRSNGEYNPSDELGTSLQDYYDKFAVQS